MRKRIAHKLAVAALAAGALLTGLAAPAAAGTDAPRATGIVHAETISRGQVINNGKAWLDNHAINYDSYHTAKGANGHYYRKDCSGFVSMALSLPSVDGGPTTETMTKYLTPIRYVGLRPGDILGLLGPGTGGPKGHVMLFVKWNNAAHTQAVVWEHGGGSGANAYPHRSVYNTPINDSLGRGIFKPWRRIHLTA